MSLLIQTIIQWAIRSQVLRHIYYAMDAVHRVDVGGLVVLFKKEAGASLRCTRALFEKESFGEWLA
jgi:hypothetical protein